MGKKAKAGNGKKSVAQMKSSSSSSGSSSDSSCNHNAIGNLVSNTKRGVIKSIVISKKGKVMKRNM